MGGKNPRLPLPRSSAGFHNNARRITIPRGHSKQLA
jgi:hypothetical protein